MMFMMFIVHPKFARGVLLQPGFKEGYINNVEHFFFVPLDLNI